MPLGIEAVQPTGGKNVHGDGREDGGQLLFQLSGSLRVLAVIDINHPACHAGFFDFLHQETDHALHASGLSADHDFSLVAAGADAPEAEMAGNEPDEPADPAVFDQVMVGSQGKNRMGSGGGILQSRDDFLKGKTGLNQFT